jgi:outer membrane protein assembly factor BamE (lipoprotein component of BamABCDE complex)
MKNLKFIIICICLLIQSCVKNTKIKGFSPYKINSEKLIELIHSKNDAIELLGSPSIISNIGGESWYYISSKEEYYALSNPKIIEQNIVELSFDQDNIISKKRYDIKDGIEIEFNESYTKTIGSEKSIFDNMLNNLGRFNKNNRKTGVKNKL